MSDRAPSLSSHRRLGRYVVLLVLALIAGSLLSACGSSGDDTGTGSTSGGEPSEVSSEKVAEVTWGFPLTDTSLSTYTPTVQKVSLLANVMQGLLIRNSAGEVEPGIATEWEQVGPTEYVYTLDTEAKFSTGNPVQLEDVLYSLRYAMDPETGNVASTNFIGVKSIDKAGPDKVKVTLEKPDSTWTDKIANYPAWIYEKAAHVSAGSNFGGPDGIPVGTGPYKVTQITDNQVTLVPNSYFNGPEPSVEKFVVRIVADDATRLAAIESGDVDGVSYVPPNSTPQWEQVPTIKLTSVPSPNIHGFIFNVTKAPFDDVHVRRAMLYAFDRESVVSSVLHDNAQIPITEVIPEMWASDISPEEAEARADEQGPEYPFDMEKAKAELAESPYPNGFSATVMYPATAPDLGLAMQVLAESLQQLNVKLTVEETSDADLFEKAVAGDFTAIAYVGSYSFPNPLNNMQVSVCGCSIPPNGYNNGRYDNPKLDQLIEEALADSNASSRVDKVMQAVAIRASDAPRPTFWFPNVVTAVNDDLVLTDAGPWQSFVTPWMADVHAAG